jgi:uncharacterized membrane protein YdjX (TVP38/TMEM64 family)
MSRKRHIALAFWLVVTLVPIIGAIIGIVFPELFLAKQEQVRHWLSQYGSWGILVFIIIQILQVVVAPISHYTTSIMGGFLYGPIWGGVYNWLGRIIGHLIAYMLSRKLGRPIVERVVDEKTISKFDNLVAGNEKTLWLRSLILFLMIFLPFFPDDELSYICGLAKFKFKYFVPVTLLGHLGGSFALAYTGAGINTRDPYFWILLTITFILFGLLLATLIRIGRQSKPTAIVDGTKSSDAL